MRQGSSNGQKNPTKHSIVPAPKQISVEANHRTRASQCTVLARLATGSTHRRRPNREAAASARQQLNGNERMPSETGGVGVRIIVRIDTVRRTECGNATATYLSFSHHHFRHHTITILSTREPFGAFTAIAFHVRSRESSAVCRTRQESTRDSFILVGELVCSPSSPAAHTTCAGILTWTHDLFLTTLRR